MSGRIRTVIKRLRLVIGTAGIKNGFSMRMLVFFGVACATFAVPAQARGASDTAAETAADTKIALKVGDLTLTQEKFNAKVEGALKKWLRKFRASGQSDTPDLERVRDVIRRKLSERFTRKLLFRNALKNTDITVPDTVVQKIWQQNVKRAGSEERMLKQLRSQGISKDTFIRNMKSRIIRRRFLKQNLGVIRVTDTEARTYFRNHSDKFGDKSFHKVKPKIKKLLGKRKRSNAMDELIEKLRKETPIKRQIPGLEDTSSP